MQSSAKRPYRMRARVEAAAETGRRILRAAIGLGPEILSDQATLDDVAERAGVTVQTVLRRFGSKEGLIVATGEEVQASYSGATSTGTEHSLNSSSEESSIPESTTTRSKSRKDTSLCRAVLPNFV